MLQRQSWAPPNPPTAGKSGAAAAAVAACALELWDPFQLSLLLDAHIAGCTDRIPRIEGQMGPGLRNMVQSTHGSGCPQPYSEWLTIDKAVQAGAASAVCVGLFEATTAACVKKAKEYRSRVPVFFFTTQLNYY